MIPGLLGSPFTMSIVDLGPAAQRLADLVARVGDDELGLPAPCPAYTLGDLIHHVGGLGARVHRRGEQGQWQVRQPDAVGGRLPAGRGLAGADPA
jgi:hypothetical protein